MNQTSPTVVRLRPHHILCVQTFLGKGYNEAFTQRMQQIVDCLKQTPQQQVQVSVAVDDACQACPRRIGSQCEDQVATLALDHAHIQEWSLSPILGKVLSWQDIREHVQQQLTKKRFDQACQTCSWHASGICESVLFPKS